nr:unnamed protein product [Callosobruchus chinensis]
MIVYIFRTYEDLEVNETVTGKKSLGFALAALNSIDPDLFVASMSGKLHINWLRLDSCVEVGDTNCIGAAYDGGFTSFEILATSPTLGVEL